MATWKYSQQKTRHARYIHFEEGVAKKLSVSDWDFSKDRGYLFRAFVVREDGSPVDKLWMVWDFESAQRLKKKLGVKSTGEREITVVMHTDDDEQSFEVL